MDSIHGHPCVSDRLAMRRGLRAPAVSAWQRTRHLFGQLSMTALNPSAIPSGINTYERLAVWAIQCLSNMANGDQVLVVEGQGQVPKAQCQFTVRADNVSSFILSAYIPANEADINNPNQKSWMAAQDISSATPHTNFLSN